ncbi:SusD/RagB family nutrient-binding outer membrane lipoprotein [Aquimarina gracilis]|uniref:SusD/RagB family nutrient-binding outer membrane lipoprotein n=1 Tax=Aquimarina gracilis TaxID=874422 RepID=A0ABU5ZSW9_9FLAO|nr:SusD/RagB family nutrient-binding outer membrane lipoprotein [Aquimarina gracilis]MEB3344886.1 SusD/RagB family nutrient-binding outer membrane lipoprotein [Aquimarina gracilis]
MKLLSHYISVVSILILGLLFTACETTELDLTENPNQLDRDQSDADLFLNSIQIDFGKVIERFGAIGGQVTRIDNMNGRDYENVYSPSDFNDLWSGSYQSTGVPFTDQNGHNQTFNGILADARALEPIAAENELYQHLAIAQVIEAYIIVTLVDFFGDVPYTEALQGSTNLNPGVDDGAIIYDAALNLLDNAIANFQKDSDTEPINDFYYRGDWEKWIQAANTIKMKIYLQERLVNPEALNNFNEIVNNGNYIQNMSDDFQFSWGTNEIQPDNRHPRYANNYEGDGADEYMSNWLMNLMSNSDDPRIRYYYYRQTNVVPGAETAPNEETLSCSLESPPQHYIDGGFTFCFLNNGYWGRDHGDDDGIPPDGFLRTNFGVYPAGGRFDDSSFEGTSQGDGGQGAGITPILLSSWVDFMIAEVAMEEMNDGAALIALQNGITKSIDKVRTFGILDNSANLSFEPDNTAIQSFISDIATNFNNAVTMEDKWNVISEQYWVALFGNGIDAYNFYRRTGYPTTLQPNIEPYPATGDFIRSFPYPADLTTNNSSVDPKPDVVQKVFWDNNPDSPAFPVSN